MAPIVYALIGTCAFVVLLAGIVAVRLLGPRRPWAVVRPSLAAFGALSLVGHRFVVGFGPKASLFGFQVALFSDVALALAAAFGAGATQRVVVDGYATDVERPRA